jgi:SAM-dependent methyltransferase
MKTLALMTRPVLAACLAILVCLNSALAQPAKVYEPSSGQPGKDVMWVPTPQSLVDTMLDVAKVTSDDFVIDLGSGDGRTVIIAAKRGAKALGIEYDENLVEVSKLNAAKEGVSDKATFVKADLFESDFSQATVITMFLLEELNLRLRPKILGLKPGTRIVSNTFDMGDWRPDEVAYADQVCDTHFYCKANFWIVPAKVEGTWKLPEGELVLRQKYQMLTGTLKIGNTSVTIDNGRMSGDRIGFSANGTEYSGKVTGNTIEGSLRATRVSN